MTPETLTISFFVPVILVVVFAVWRMVRRRSFVEEFGVQPPARRHYRDQDTIYAAVRAELESLRGREAYGELELREAAESRTSDFSTKQALVRKLELELCARRKASRRAFAIARRFGAVEKTAKLSDFSPKS